MTGLACVELVLGRAATAATSFAQAASREQDGKVVLDPWGMALLLQ
jgi:hypothetical protein